MQLTADWQAVLRYAWSVRFIVLSLVLSGIEALLPYVQLPVSPGVFAALSAVAGAAAFFARLIAQKNLGGQP